jgi:hypothetical protein
VRWRRRRQSSSLVSFIKRWRIPFATVTVLLQAAAIIAVVFVFPDVSNLWVSIFVLVSGLTAGLTSLADLLVSAEESDRDQQEAGHPTD